MSVLRLLLYSGDAISGDITIGSSSSSSTGRR